mmetsp:Transcript_99759/g.321452  ORF Transcript_99759/g.321452 Transcript_99759/m.321452 type:complete len:195 (+) Transcript_99759:53-637(+)
MRGGTASIMRGPRPAPERKTSSSENREATFLSSLISLSAWALGVGILALPRAIALCGPRCGIAFLMTFALWVDLSLRWVVACGRCSGKSGFRENALFFLGQPAARVVYIGQVLLLCGGMIAVFSTAASLLGCSAKELLDCLCHEEQEEEEEEAEGQIPPTVDWADSEAGGYIAAASDLSSASGVGTSRRSAAGC